MERVRISGTGRRRGENGVLFIRIGNHEFSRTLRTRPPDVLRCRYTHTCVYICIYIYIYMLLYTYVYWQSSAKHEKRNSDIHPTTVLYVYTCVRPRHPQGGHRVKDICLKVLIRRTIPHVKRARPEERAEDIAGAIDKDLKVGVSPGNKRTFTQDETA